MEGSGPPLLTDARRQEDLARASRDWPSWTLSRRQLGDLELILNGGYAPLDRFMTRADADACAHARRLSDGTPFPAPVLLAVSDACAADAVAARRLVLRDPEGVPLAVLDVLDSWHERNHFVGGPVVGLQLPVHPDAVRVRHTPRDVAREISGRGWSPALAFPTRGLIHRAEHGATQAAIADANAGLVVIALSDPEEDDSKRLMRVRCLEAVMPQYGRERALVWLVPLPQRANPVADMLLAAVVARNAGCTGLLATERLDDNEKDSISRFARESSLTFMHRPADADTGTFPEVARALSLGHPQSHGRGFTVFFTGLSGSGKSTIANLVRVKLLERTGRPVTLLDGDIVRQHLSSELGFSREHRDLNVRRIAFVASEITRHGGIAICAPIAPYDSVRQEARRAIEAVGGFVLVFVDTPLEVCEARDRKGLYAKARAGLIREFTGISDPYEPPADADLVIRTAEESAHDSADRILAYLEHHGYVMAGGEP